MKLTEIKKHLASLEAVNFRLPNGSFVPDHFHVTEVGQVTKNYIDCGGTVRSEKVVSFQLWTSDDTEHRLRSKKLLGIIELSEKVLGIEDLEIEVEYQNDTIGKYSLGFDGTDFLLLAKQTDCLAKDNCGVPDKKKKLQLADMGKETNACPPGGKCC